MSSSRTEILKRIKGNKPLEEVRRSDQLTVTGYQYTLSEFKNNLEGVGGKVSESESYALTNFDGINEAKELESIGTVVIKGVFGVAENGAVWVNEEQMAFRVAPFICEELVILLDKQEIVATMHEAYERLKGMDMSYGVFISGPSKTADIEQSLVIGAHGAKSLKVVFI